MTPRFLSFPAFFSSLFLLASALLPLSCNNENAPDCLKSTGKTVQQQRSIAAFTEIILHDDIELYLDHRTDSTVLIEAGENLIPKIEILQDGTTLTIRNRNTCNWTRSYKRSVKVTVGVPHDNLVLTHRGFGKIHSLDPLQIDYLIIGSFDASGDVQLDGKLDYITIYSNSPAHITLSGESQYLQAWLHNNFGRLSAEHLQAKVCNLTHDGSNEMRVFPVDELQAKISANGTIAYYNDPGTITSEIKGNGKLVKR